MEELTLTTPALLFSAVSLILLAYTNRFLSYAQLVRQLRDRYVENPSDITEAQIENLRKRLNLTRTMQGLGIASLFLCVVSMFLIYIGLQLFSAYVFGLALILLIASLGVSFREIQISTRSQGAGLGLSICQVIIEKLGGRIELKSEVGKGSRFTVILPCRVVS